MPRKKERELESARNGRDMKRVKCSKSFIFKPRREKKLSFGGEIGQSQFPCSSYSEHRRATSMASQRTNICACVSQKTLQTSSNSMQNNVVFSPKGYMDLMLHYSLNMICETAKFPHLETFHFSSVSSVLLVEILKRQVLVMHVRKVRK